VAVASVKITRPERTARVLRRQRSPQARRDSHSQRLNVIEHRGSIEAPRRSGPFHSWSNGPYERAEQALSSYVRDSAVFQVIFLCVCNTDFLASLPS